MFRGVLYEAFLNTVDTSTGAPVRTPPFPRKFTRSFSTTVLPTLQRRDVICRVLARTRAVALQVEMALGKYSHEYDAAEAHDVGILLTGGSHADMNYPAAHYTSSEPMRNALQNLQGLNTQALERLFKSFSENSHAVAMRRGTKRGVRELFNDQWQARIDLALHSDPTISAQTLEDAAARQVLKFANLNAPPAEWVSTPTEQLRLAAHLASDQGAGPSSRRNALASAMAASSSRGATQPAVARRPASIQKRARSQAAGAAEGNNRYGPAHTWRVRAQNCRIARYASGGARRRMLRGWKASMQQHSCRMTRHVVAELRKLMHRCDTLQHELTGTPSRY